ncbi:MAG: hypothetical protein ACXACK_17250, partial [Candidatus Hodarchaeales archaeon]
MPNYVEEFSIDSKISPKIWYYNEIRSTNDLARTLIEKEKKIGFSIVTKTQTRGRGQRGRTWESPNGGLWTSLAIRPQNELKH